MFHKHILLLTVNTIFVTVYEISKQMNKLQFTAEDLGRPCAALPPIANVVRTANCYRSSARPNDPQDLSFAVNESHIPAS